MKHIFFCLCFIAAEFSISDCAPVHHRLVPCSLTDRQPYWNSKKQFCHSGWYLSSPGKSAVCWRSVAPSLFHCNTNNMDDDDDMTNDFWIQEFFSICYVQLGAFIIVCSLSEVTRINKYAGKCKKVNIATDLSLFSRCKLYFNFIQYHYYCIYKYYFWILYYLGPE